MNVNNWKGNVDKQDKEIEFEINHAMKVFDMTRTEAISFLIEVNKEQKIEAEANLISLTLKWGAK